MARARNIKPGFFTNEDLVELDFATRLLFAGLWTIADREGRFEDRPKKIKIAIFPADNVEVDVMLQALHDMGFVQRYEVNGAKYVQITSWVKHQNPHHTEKASVIPDVNGELTVKAPLKPSDAPKDDGGNLADSLIPDSLIPDSRDTAPRKARRVPRQEITLAQYLETCKAEGKKPIPADHAVRDYCSQAGIADDMLQIAWLAFKDRHLNADKTKTYRDWPGAFANSVKDRWYRLWIVNEDGVATWTANGVQERRVAEARLTQQTQPQPTGEPA